MPRSKSTLYDIVKRVLETYPNTRDSDKLLIWRVWFETGHVRFNPGEGYSVSLENFLDANPAESIRRNRQMIQAEFEYLKPSDQVQAWRNNIETQKGTHVFREELKETQTA